MRLRAQFRGLLISALTAGALVALPVASASAATPVGVLGKITPGLLGFDSLNVETQAQIDCLSQTYGYSYDVINTNALTSAGSYREYNAAATAGMKVVLFQGYRTNDTFWTTAANGTSRGTDAVTAANTVGYPKGAQIFLDLEATGTAQRSTVVAWVKNWAAEVKRSGYLAGIYVGADSGLEAADLNTVPYVSVYWKSASTSGVPVAARGYVLQQQPPPAFDKSLCGTRIDDDIAGIDRNGAQLVGAAFPVTPAKTTSAGTFNPLTPARLLDTRSGLGGSGPVGASRFVDLQVTGRGGVPTTGVSTVVVNVTVTAPTSAGFVGVYPTPAGSTRPDVSNLNFVARQTVANLVSVPVGVGGKVRLFNGSAGGAQFLADVAGYYLSGTDSVPGAFVPVGPQRVLNSGATASSTTTITLAGRPGIPTSGFDAAVLNVTAVAPAKQGFLTAYPAGAQRPNASNLNFLPKQIVPNLATVPVLPSGSGAGKIALFNGSAGSVKLLADVAGYYRSGARAASGAFSPLTTPTRILDTRKNLGSVGKVPALKAISLLVRGRAGVPTGASAVVLTVTVTGPAAGGYLTVFPSDRSAPVASNVNFVPQQTIANQVVVPIGKDGRIILLNQSGGTIDLFADVAGYFLT
ncbi:hypothetical protein ABIB25_004687 [Nakamurella sp. UYEF19]|uniref:glycoside hydrolase domain-containing protein n=1 Tax=Nakamurella sp. UYEF19 TaxID=1756392 RepID=UPI0033919CB8